jgi:hypothetical protein
VVLFQKLRGILLNIPTGVAAHEGTIRAELQARAANVVFGGSDREVVDSVLMVLRQGSPQEAAQFFDALGGYGIFPPEQLLALDPLLAELRVLPPIKWGLGQSELPRIFIGHSLSGAAEFVEKLGEGLRAEGYPVAVADVAPGAGVNPAAILFEGLGDCAVAVLALDELASGGAHALLGLARLLRWRAWSGETIRMLVVCAGQLSEAELLAAPGWSRLGLRAGEVAVADGTALDEAVLEALAPLREGNIAKSRLELLQDVLAGYFRNNRVQESNLKDALTRINDVSPIGAPGNAPVTHFLARELLRHGVRAFLPLYTSLSGLLDTKELEDILNLLRPSWVDPRAAGMLSRVMAPPADAAAPPGRVFALNSEEVETGLMYARRASVSRTPKLEWKWLELTGREGNFTPEIFLDDLRTLLNKELLPPRPVRAAPEAEGLRHKLNERIDALLKERRPVIVPLPQSLAEDEEVINTIRAYFPNLVLLLLSGSQVAEGLIEGAEMLDPLLGPEDENNAFEEYYNAADLLRA